MTVRELLLILISFLLGLACIQCIRLLDRYEREPFAKLVLATLVGGGCAAMLALGLFDLIARLGFSDFESLVGAMFIIGPVEELAKLAGLLLIFGFVRNELNEPADGMIYIACVALGFSLVENYLYAAQPAQDHLIVIRLVAGTPLHICFSALMGLSFYLFIKKRQAWYLVAIAYLLASLSHGLYDLIVFNHHSVLLLGAAFLVMYGFTRNLFIYALTISPHRLPLSQTLATASHDRIEHTQACLRCGDLGGKPAYAIAGTELQHCRSCDHFGVTLDGLFRLFYHFAGILKQAARQHLKPSAAGSEFMTLYQGNHICPQQKRACFRLNELDTALERLNYATKARMRSEWYLPSNLFRLTQPGVTIDYPKMARDAKAALWHRLTLPLTAAKGRTYRPPENGPLWLWQAFMLPELWFAAKGIWGAVFFITGVYALTLYGALSAGLALTLPLGVAGLAIRILAGAWGARIYYRRYGRWP